MVSFSLSPASKHRLFKWLVLVVVLFLTPFGATYWHLHQMLAVEKCVFFQDHRNATTVASQEGSPTNGLVCKAPRKGPYFFDTLSLSQSPPSIARLATEIAKARGTPSSSSYAYTGSDTDVKKISINIVRERLQMMDRWEEMKKQQLEEDAETNFYVYDYAEESFGGGGFFGFRKQHSRKSAAAMEHTNEVQPALGFRRNPNRDSSTSYSSAAAPSMVSPVTYFWLFLNVGLYGYYMYKKIDSSRVSLNGKLLAGGGDLGRALSGNLAHFEVWHLGLNAWSLAILGEGLEHEVLEMGGSVGLFLWTSSFLVLTALGVVGLHIIDRRFGGLWRRGRPSPQQFPNMVGFSGVLFAWSVARTLSLSEYQEICLIRPMLCFSTHTLMGGFRFSWYPIVQLVLLQVLMKRVSFVGHLSGLLVGFLWHWGFLPPLEVSQPCVLYPVLWMTCKSALHHFSGFAKVLAGTAEEEMGFAFASGSYLGGGEILGGGSGSRWTLSNISEEGEDEGEHGQQRLPRIIVFLKALQRFALVHFLGMVYVSRRRDADGGFVLVNSVVLSEVLLLVIFSLFVKATTRGSGRISSNAKLHPLASFGVLGRAHFTFCLVAFVTDSMALGGWWAMLPVWETPIFVWILWGTRFALWIMSCAGVCNALEFANELQLSSCNTNTNSTSADGSDSRNGIGPGAGIWSLWLGWTAAEPCAFLGELILTKSNQAISFTTTPTAVANAPTVVSKSSGRSSSNLAGKSRLVDRGSSGTMGARGIV